jgi:hypothetical protein
MSEADRDDMAHRPARVIRLSGTRRSRATLTCLLLLTWLLVACSATPPATTSPSESPSLGPGQHALPTFQPTVDGVPVACAGVGYLGEVTIHGSTGDPALTWIVFEPEGRRENLLWPAGYQARFTPALEVLDPSGRVVAREGDRVTGGCAMPPGGTFISLPTITSSPTPPG